MILLWIKKNWLTLTKKNLKKGGTVKHGGQAPAYVYCNAKHENRRWSGNPTAPGQGYHVNAMTLNSLQQ